MGDTEGGERKREKHQSVALHTYLDWWSNPQLGYVLRLGTEPVTFVFWYNAPINWATLARANILTLLNYPHTEPFYSPISYNFFRWWTYSLVKLTFAFTMFYISSVSASLLFMLLLPKNTFLSKELPTLSFQWLFKILQMHRSGIKGHLRHWLMSMLVSFITNAKRCQ